jgi:hypothetical protein
MKRSVFSDGSAILAIMFCLLSCSFTVQAQSQTGQSNGSIQSVNVAEDGQCLDLGAFLQEEFSKNSKPLKSNPAVRLLGLQEKDAVKKALNLCIKLKATEMESAGDDLIYELPNGLGSIVIREVYRDDIFLKLKLETACDKLPFVEIWYVGLKRYNNG